MLSWKNPFSTLTTRLLSTLLFPSLFIGLANAAEKPNILLIFMDDMGLNDIGAFAYPDPPDHYPTSGPAPKPNQSGTLMNPIYFPEPNLTLEMTPRIDSLAAEGLKMKRFYASQSCSPSRAALMTGRYDSRVSLSRVINVFPGKGLNTSEVTLPELLNIAGYRTALVGKWHLGYGASEANPHQYMPRAHGFSRFYGVPTSNNSGLTLFDNETTVKQSFTDEDQATVTWRYTEKTLEYLEEFSAEDEPFFLMLSHSMTHLPSWPSDREFRNADGTTWPKFLGSSGFSYYYDVVKEVDHGVGRILDKLDDLGIADNTIVVFTSDNGAAIRRGNPAQAWDFEENSGGSSYPLKDGKLTTWDGGVRVPFLVRWPGNIPQGVESEEVVGLIDLLPTFVSIGGGDIPTDRTIDGIDLTNLWKNPSSWTTPRTEYAIFNNVTAGSIAAMYDTSKFKLRGNVLYDLDADIQEMTDIGSSNSSMKNYLTSRRNSLNASLANETVPLGSFTSYEVVPSEKYFTVPEGGTKDISLTLSANPGKTVTVSVAPYGGDGDLVNTAGSTRVFTTSNWNIPQAVSFQAMDDADDQAGVTAFEITTDDIQPVITVYATEDDDDVVLLNLNLLPQGVEEFMVMDRSAMLDLSGELSLGGQINPTNATYSWHKVSGPGTVAFGTPNASATSVEFSEDGNYVIRLTGDHPSATYAASASVLVRVGPPASGDSLVGEPKLTASFAYSSDRDTPGDAIWENFLAPGSRNWSVSGNVTLILTDPAPNLNFINSAWSFPGQSIPSGATSPNLDTQGQSSATLEFWIRPAAIPAASPQIIWETGGSTGSALVINGSELWFVADSSGTGARVEAMISPQASQDGFLHCVAVIDLTGNQLQLFIDGVPRDSAPIPNLIDWAGSSGTGLGTIADGNATETTNGGQLGGNQLIGTSYSTFQGQIAYHAFHSRALSTSEISDLSQGPFIGSNIPTEFELTDVVKLNDAAEARWFGENGKSYKAWYSTDLNIWYSSGEVFAGQDTELSAPLIPGPTAPKLFLRISEF